MMSVGGKEASDYIMKYGAIIFVLVENGQNVKETGQQQSNGDQLTDWFCRAAKEVEEQQRALRICECEQCVGQKFIVEYDYTVPKDIWKPSVKDTDHVATKCFLIK